MKMWALVGRVAAVGASTIVLLPVAFGLAAVGQGQYLEDYCITRAPRPQGLTEATGGHRPAFLENLITVGCSYDHYPDVLVTDSSPLLWVIGVTSTAAVITALLWWGMVIRPWRAWRYQEQRRAFFWEGFAVGGLGFVLTAVPTHLLFFWGWTVSIIELLSVLALSLPAALMSLALAWLITQDTNGPGDARAGGHTERC